MKKLNKRGFSLVEVIIAMTVVTIVTLTAISIIYSGSEHTIDANAKSDAIYFVADVIECFKATATPEELLQALDKRVGVNCTHSYIEPSGQVAEAEYKMNGSNLRVSIKIDVKYSGPAGLSATRNYVISVEAKDEDNGNIILNTQYQKAARGSYETEETQPAT